MLTAGGAHKNGERYFLLGVSEDEIALMKQGRPIQVDGHKIGIPGRLVVFYGPTEEHMLKDFESAGIQLPDEAI